MRIARAILLVLAAVNGAMFLDDGRPLNGVCALVALACWLVMGVARANAVIDRIHADDPIGGRRCRCAWLGAGTPEHEASPMCIALRPDADRDPS